MPYCKKCGAELPEFAMFCSKCGIKYPVSSDADDEAPTEEATSNIKAPAVATEKQTKTAPNIAGWFKTNAMSLYVILGVISVVLLQLSENVISLSTGFSVTLSVFAIICSVAF